MEKIAVNPIVSILNEELGDLIKANSPIAIHIHWVEELYCLLLKFIGGIPIVRELGPWYRAWALEPVFLGPKPHSTSYNRPHTWTLSLDPDTSEPNLGPRTRNKTTLNTSSKPPPPPIISDLDRRVLARRCPVPSCPAMHLTTSLPSWQ